MFVLPNCSGGIVPSRGRDAPWSASVSIVEDQRRTQLQASWSAPVALRALLGGAAATTVNTHGPAKGGHPKADNSRNSRLEAPEATQCLRASFELFLCS
jgi:hypothetical protein